MARKKGKLGRGRYRCGPRLSKLNLLLPSILESNCGNPAAERFGVFKDVLKLQRATSLLKSPITAPEKTAELASSPVKRTLSSRNEVQHPPASQRNISSYHKTQGGPESSKRYQAKLEMGIETLPPNEL